MPYRGHFSLSIFVKVETSSMWNAILDWIRYHNRHASVLWTDNENKSKIRWNNKCQANNGDVLSTEETLTMPGCLTYQGLFWI